MRQIGSAFRVSPGQIGSAHRLHGLERSLDITGQRQRRIQPFFGLPSKPSERALSKDIFGVQFPVARLIDKHNFVDEVSISKRTRSLSGESMCFAESLAEKRQCPAVNTPCEPLAGNIGQQRHHFGQSWQFQCLKANVLRTLYPFNIFQLVL